jgi:PAS domain S-box-containing protein
VDDKNPTSRGTVSADDAEVLYDHSPCGHLCQAPDGTVVKVNQTFLSWTGYRREQVVGRMRWTDLLTPGGRIYHETHYSPLLRMQGFVREVAVTVVCADGTRLPVLVSSRLFVDDDKEAIILTSVFPAEERRRYEQELLAARRQAEEASQQLALMQVVAVDLATAGDLAEVHDVLLRAGQELLSASACVLSLRGMRDQSRMSTDVEDERLLQGRVVVLPVDEAARRFPTATAGLRTEGRAVVALAPLLAQRRLLGVLGCRFDGLESLSESEQDLLRTLAGQAALALPRALLFEQQRDVAQTLQHSLLPARLPSDPRFTLTTVYRPARNGPAVGGDWYDAFWVARDLLAVVVGDVVGRGVHAAAAMGQLRTAIRALASVTPQPAQVLEALDRFVDDLPAANSATVVYGLLDLTTGRLRYACAGHPPPVLVHGSGEATVLWGGRWVPLGIRVPGVSRGEAEVELPPGSRVFMYTDGLVERRDRPLDARIAELADVLSQHSPAPPAVQVESVAEAMLDDDQVPDDVCLLCVSLADAAGPGSSQ